MFTMYETLIKSLKEHINELKEAVNYGGLHEEGEGYNPYGSPSTAYNKTNLSLQKKRLNQALEWDIATTKSRRDAWNIQVVNLPGFSAGKVGAEHVRALEEELGFRFATMKEFVRLHDLKKENA